MIRPITCVGFLLACASGLYLYQAKHRVSVLDQQIERTVHASDAAREQIRLLHAEWTLLNQPDRLQQLADQFLSLKPTTPNQFTSMAELDSRLPPITPILPPSQTPPGMAVSSVPMADAAQPGVPQGTTASMQAAASQQADTQAVKHDLLAAKAPEPPRPVPPKPVDHPRPVAEPRPYRPSAPVELAVAPRPAPPLVHPHVIQAAEPRPYWPQRPIAAAPQPPAPAYAPGVMGGSMLGMAQPRPGTVAPPAPVPVTGWASSGGS